MLHNNDPEITASPTPLPVSKGIGDTCESTPWRIKLTGKDEMQSLGQEPLTTIADSGKLLLILYFDVTNISEADDYFNYMYFKAEVDGQKAELILPAVTTINEHNTAIGTVADGETAAFCVVYQVPKNWTTFKISYDIGGVTSKILAAFEIKA